MISKRFREITAILLILAFWVSTLTTASAGTFYKKGIIVIPGYLGTRLYENSYKIWPPQSLDSYIDSNGDPLQEPNLLPVKIVANILLPFLGNLIVNKVAENKKEEVYKAVRNDFSKIECDENGISKRTIKTEPSVSVDGIYGALNEYGPIMKELKNNFEGTSCEVCFFPYDWRMSFESTAMNLQEFINNKGFDSVTLVAHSAGGLITARYLALSEANRKKAETVCLLGTPNFGTPEPLKVIETGTILGNELDDILGNQVKSYAPNLPSTYYLLPSRKYIDSIGKYITTCTANKYTNCSGPELSDEIQLGFDDSIKFIKNKPWMKKSDGSLKPFLDDAIRFHDSLFINGNYVLNMVNTHLYVGGVDKATNPSTAVSCIKYYDTIKEYNNQQLTYPIHYYRPPVYYKNYTTTDADGTVISANACAGGLVSNVYTYKDVTHFGLPKSTQVFENIINLIKAKSNNGYAWISGSIHPKATLGSDNESWNWVSENPKALKNGYSHQSAIYSGMHQHYFSNSDRSLSITRGQVLYCNIFMDPANPPREIMLQWNDGSGWEHRAYWGEDLIGFGKAATSSRYYKGPLPKSSMWVRLEVPASSVALEGQVINGMAYTLYGGRATWGEAGVMESSDYKLNNAPPETTCYYNPIVILDPFSSSRDPISSVSKNGTLQVFGTLNANPSMNVMYSVVRIGNESMRVGYSIKATQSYMSNYTYATYATVRLADLDLAPGTYFMDCDTYYKNPTSNLPKIVRTPIVYINVY